VIAAHVQRARQEWRSNRRLRLGTLVILLIAGAHAASALSERRAAIAADYGRDLELLQRLEEASREALWPKRASQAEARLRAERDSVPPVPTAGAAKAEMQAWLAAQLPPTGVRVERIEVETAADVPDYPGLWQVPARFDVVAPLGKVRDVMRMLSDALPWVQAERVEASGEGETRLSIIVRGYYRKGARRPADTAKVGSERSGEPATDSPSASPPSAARAASDAGTPGRKARAAETGRPPSMRGIVPSIAREPVTGGGQKR